MAGAEDEVVEPEPEPELDVLEPEPEPELVLAPDLVLEPEPVPVFVAVDWGLCKWEIDGSNGVRLTVLTTVEPALLVVV